MDGHRLKLEKVGPTFSSLMLCLQKPPDQKIIRLVLPGTEVFCFNPCALLAREGLPLGLGDSFRDALATVSQNIVYVFYP